MAFEANKLLAEERLHGIDHERKNEVHLTAALVRTNSGRFFAKANLQLPKTPTTRNCGELLALTDAVYAEGPDVEITDLWFMAARADIEKPGREYIKEPIIEKDRMRYCLPCGSCLASIWDLRLNRTRAEKDLPETQIHSLPANLGNGTLPDERLKPEQIETRTISQLLPNLPVGKEDPDGSLKRTIKAGWKLLTHDQKREALEVGTDALKLQVDSLVKLKRMRGKPENEIKKVVNDVMVDAMQDLVGRSVTEVENARVVVVRTEDGDYFMGASIGSRMVSGMQFAEHDAIDDVQKFTPTGTRITDVFIYAVDFGQVEETTKTWGQKAHKGDPVLFDAPDGSILRRISALSPNGGQKCTDLAGNEIDKKTGANIHFIVPNDKKDFTVDTHMVSTTLSELLLERWQSPSMQKLLSRNGREGESVTLQ